MEYWEEFGDDENIQGPPDTDNDYVTHGLKPGGENGLNTIPQCTFECTAMNWYFQMFSDKKNKDTQINMEGMNCTLYREKKGKT